MRYNILYGNNEINLNAYQLSNSVSARGDIMALHGFTGSGRDFEELAKKSKTFNWYSMDFLGHGDSDMTENLKEYSLDHYLGHVDSVLDQLNINQCVLLGYSMGGRIGLHYALQRPSKIKALVLIAGNPGIQNLQKRKERQIQDKQLTEKIKLIGVERFIDYWLQTPVIKSQINIKEKVKMEILGRRYKNHSVGLINNLLGLGAGNLPSLWQDLHKLECPVLLVVGENDHKFIKIAEKMQKEIQEIDYRVVPSTGHAAHLENMPEFINILEEWQSFKTF